ncbi:NAD(P)H-dependent oxidoreductase [Amycolatopsis sp. K13G38]|uniref:NAD(P)H-dependent oxidoreductase n=1 Tax=Amycolatopsis acididurans TaxID=2724524 RepID=A0ABX1J4T1_9PSEU|nr:NADPH-dependent FMN reductase [Amycolatopsis acididurans]NKQ54801.1 NAD(P)H-dependent oxidoreductase [Amycolatopsis acididurans]
MRILTVCGSLRDGSTNAAVLRTVTAIAPAEVDIDEFDGLAVLPHFNPDEDTEPLHPAVADYRARLGAADAVLFCTPEYAGALPGSFKNLLDWSVGAETMYGKPVAWINASWAPTGAADAHASLRIVLGYLSVNLVEAACVQVPVGRTSVGADGLVHDETARARLRDALEALVKAS